MRKMRIFRILKKIRIIKLVTRIENKTVAGVLKERSTRVEFQRQND